MLAAEFWTLIVLSVIQTWYAASSLGIFVHLTIRMRAMYEWTFCSIKFNWTIFSLRKIIFLLFSCLRLLYMNVMCFEQVHTPISSQKIVLYHQYQNSLPFSWLLTHLVLSYVPVRRSITIAWIDHISSKKTDSPSCKRHHLPIAPRLRVEFCNHLHFSWWILFASCV